MKKNLFSLLACLFVLGFSFTACDIGLGNQVDVSTPEASITYPEAESIIRGAFVLKGSCSDDLGVTDIKVRLCQTDTSTGKLYNVTDEVSAEISTTNSAGTSGTWQLQIDPANFDGKQLADGSYVAKAVAYDKGGHKSSELSLSFAIDNNAPVFVLQSPSSKVLSESSSFGRTVKLTGLVSDDHTIAKMIVDVYPETLTYDDDGNPVKKTSLEFNNIAASEFSSGKVIAQFNSDVESGSITDAESVKLNENYKAIYGDVSDPSTFSAQKYFLVIKLIDNAKECTDSSSDSTTGNESAFYFNSDDIYDKFLRAGGSSYNIGVEGIKNILNGSYSGTTISDEDLALLEAKKIRTDNYTDDEGVEHKVTDEGATATMSVNPLNNPVYKVLNCDVDSAATLSKKEAVNYNVEAGLDGTSVWKDSLVVHFYKISKDTSARATELPTFSIAGGYTGSTTSENFTFVIPEVYPDVSSGSLLSPEDIYVDHKTLDTTKVKTVTNESYSFLVGTDVSVSSWINIEPGDQFEVEIGGYDQNESFLVEKTGNYGFSIQTSGTAPKITVSSFTAKGSKLDNLSYTNVDCISGSNKIELSGSVTTDSPMNVSSGLTAVLSVSNEDLSFNEECTGVSVALTKKDNVEYEWSIDASDLVESAKKTAITNQLKTDTLLYTITLTAADTNGLESSVSRQFYVDTVAPVISFDDPSPLISETVDNVTSYYINGAISLGGKVDELNPSSGVLTVTSNGVNVATDLKLNKAFSSSIVFDTINYGCTDNKEIEFTATFTDKAGNSASKTFSASRGYTLVLKQSTDMPSVSFTAINPDIHTVDDLKADADNMTNVFNAANSGSKIGGVVSDDDGIKDIKVMSSTDGTTYTEIWPKGTVTFTGSKTYTLPTSATLTSEGVRYINVIVTDVNNGSAVYGDTGYSKLDMSKSPEKPIAVYIDNGAPSITETGVGTSGKNTKDSFTFKGVATETAHLNSIVISEEKEVDGKTVDEEIETITSTSANKWTQSGTSYSFTSNAITVGSGNKFEDGTHLVKITAWDEAGYSSSITRTVVVDTTAPAVTGTSVMTSGTTVSGTTYYANNGLVPVAVNVGDGTGTGVTNVYYCVENSAGVKGSWSAMTNNGTSSYPWTATATCSEGLNNIYFYAVDVTKNESSKTEVSLPVNLDLTGPVISFVSVDGSTDAGTKLVNGTTSVKVIVQASDAAAGVSSVYLEQIDSVARKSVNNGVQNADGSWTVTITTDNFATGAVTIGAKDALGNTSTKSVFTMALDNENPTATISEITDADSSTDGIQVNGIITVSGTASDNNTLSAVKLYYSTDKGSNWTEIPCSGTYNWKSGNIDTTDSALNGKTIYFKAEPVDTAGNKGSCTKFDDATTACVVVDQNTDRPVITLTNASVDKSNPSILKQNTIYGNISDDDGTIKNLYYTEESANKLSTSVSDWNAVAVSGGAFSIKCDSDGAHTLFFWAVDKKGKNFYSASTSAVDAPYFADDTLSKQTVDEIDFTVDTKAPEVTIYLANSSSVLSADSTEWQDASNISFGGNTPYLCVKAVVTEETGMDADAPVTLKVGDTEVVNPTISKTGTLPNLVYIIGPVNLGTKTGDTYDYSDGTVTCSVTAKDAAQQEKPSSKNIVIDNTAPTLTVNSPSEDTRITSTVTIRGSFADNAGGSGIDTIQWMVPAKGVTPTTSTTTGWNEVTRDSGSNSWTIVMNSTDSGNTLNPLTYADKDKYNITPATEDEANGIWFVPIYFLMKDKMGNTGVDYCRIRVDEYGGRPTAEIIYPTTDSSIGGIMRVYGIATDIDGSISSVQLQMDFDGDYDFDASDYAVVKAWSDAKYEPYYGNLVHNSDTDWGITIPDGADNWNVILNRNSEFNTYGTLKADGTKTPVSFRARAYDNQGLSHGWYGDKSGSTINKYVSVTIATGNPLFGNTQEDVCQFSGDPDGTATLTKKYEAGMYLSGNWWLIADLKDEQGIKEATITADEDSGSVAGKLSADTANPDSTVKVQIGSTGKYIWFIPDVKDSDGDTKYTIESAQYAKGYRNYTVAIPLCSDVANSSTGAIKSTVVLIDASENMASSQTPVEFNIDNTPPSFYNDSGVEVTTADSSIRLKTGSDLVSDITQSDYSYTFGDKVTDSGSGFDKIIFYFKRTATSGDSNVRIYNPMLSSSRTNIVTTVTDSSTTSAKEGKVFINSESVPVLASSGVLNSDTFTPTTSSQLVSNKNVREGGLAKIAGTYYLISEVNYTTGVVKFVSNSIPDSVQGTTAQQIQFVYGQVVDHKVTSETPYESDFDTEGNIKPIEATDDGDGMIEYISVAGAQATWTATINSKHVVDGPAEIHVVAFDKAGNFLHGYRSCTVQNNRPRMASVYLATDLDRNGKFTYSSTETETAGIPTYGEFSKYSTLKNKKTVYSAVLDSADFTAKKELLIMPEFVNDDGDVSGNGDISYIMNIASSTADNITEAVKYVSGTNTLADFSSKTEVTALVDGDDASDILFTHGAIILDSELSDSVQGAKKIQLSFWDHTEGLTCGTTTQNAVLNIPLTINTKDTIKPFPVINPFYWNSNTDNSLYENSRSNGHIELEADLPSTFLSTNTSGINDRDPKVSGKISMTGYVYDDTVISTITMQIAGYALKSTAGTASTVATYSSGWTGSSGTGWTFTVTDLTNGPSQVGHLVKWQLDIDTSYVSGVAALDKAVVITASDGTNTSDAQSVQTGSTTSTVYATDKEYTLGKFYSTAAAASTADSTYLARYPGTAVLTKSDSADTTYTTVYAYTYNESGYYKMDIVPYVLKVETGLSKQKKTNWSVYNRSALGHYPVQSVVSNVKSGVLNTTTSEDVTLHGFNLNGTTVSIKDKSSSDITVTKTAATSTALSQLKFNVASLASGSLTATVNSINIMNNYNNNDAMGSAAEDGTNNVNKYNMQGNGDTNNILNDDLVFDVWEFDDRAAKPINGMATGVQMKVNQSSKMLNFAFADGGLFYSMGDSTYSSRYWAGDWDTYAGPCVGLGVDSLGYTYSVDSGGDTNDSGSADKYVFYTSRWGQGLRSQRGTYNEKNDSGFNALRMEEIALKTGSGTFDYSLMKYRYLSSEFATSVSGSTTNLYLVNYDALTDEIRFRAGAISSTSYAFSNSSSKSTSNFGGFNDTYNSGTPSNYATAYCQVIANNSSADSTFVGNGASTTVSAITDRGAGQYVDIAIAKNSSSKDVACVVWFDAYENCLKYTYATDPVTNWTGTHKGNRTANGWSTPVTIFSEGGEYCHIAVDANNHIHIAAYAGNGDVKYAYLASYNSDYDESTNSCTVDASGSVGEHLTLDVALDSSGNSIPYIGYFTSAIKAPKYAYLVDTTDANHVPEGVDDSELFTGAWEVTVVPTPSRLTTNREDKVNIGVFKTTAGVLNYSTTNGNAPGTSNIGTNYCSTSVNGYSSTEESKCYGNGSKNAVFAYQISGGTGSCIETAQMR